MTDIAAAGNAAHVAFAGPLVEAERQVRAFLVTASRYLASGRELPSLDRIEAGALDADSLSADEFNSALLGIWQNPGK